MIYAKGTVSSLLEVAEAFKTFCLTSNGTTNAWTLIHDETDSFYGTTLRFAGLEADSYGYISFFHKRIVKGTTYNEWYNDTFHYLSEPYLHTGIDSSGNSNTVSGSSGTVDIFNENGYMLPFSVHKQYSSNIYMVEQGGGYKLDGTDMNLLPFKNIYQTSTNTSEWTFIPPPFPGTGMPMLCMSDDNIDNTYGINYYFVRTNNSATITININDMWQTISLGFLDGIDTDTYKFPAYVSGGSLGLKNSLWIYTPYGSMYPTYLSGNTITLDMRFIGMSNATLVNSTKFNSNVSNFLIMSADGVWENYYNYAQECTVKPYYTPVGAVTNWGTQLEKPTKSGNHNGIFPNDTDTTKLLDGVVYSSGTYEAQYMLFPIMPYKYSLSDGDYGVIGFVQNCFALFSNYASEGVVTINNINYLIVPNGWKDRALYYPSHIGVYAEWQITDLAILYKDIINYRFCYLAIKLEE
jgi:hypothetical protein